MAQRQPQSEKVQSARGIDNLRARSEVGKGDKNTDNIPLGHHKIQHGHHRDMHSLVFTHAHAPHCFDNDGDIHCVLQQRLAFHFALTFVILSINSDNSDT